MNSTSMIVLASRSAMLKTPTGVNGILTIMAKAKLNRNIWTPNIIGPKNRVFEKGEFLLKVLTINRCESGKRMASLLSDYIEGQISSEEFYSQFLFETESSWIWLKTPPNHSS